MDDLFQAVHVRRWGKSYVLILPKVLREFLGLSPNDLVGFRKCGRYVIVKRLRAGEVMPLTEEEARREAAAVGS